MSQALDSISAINAPFDILVLGNKGVGKSTLIQKYVLGDQPTRPPDTSEFMTFKKLELACDCSLNANYQIPSASIHKSISILDSSTEINDLLTSDTYQIKNARTMLFAYAVDDSDSFEALDYTINCITSVRQELPPCVVVCLKLDKSIDRQVLYEQGKELADSCGAIDFLEACATTQTSVDHVFQPLVEQVLRIQDQECASHEEECFTNKLKPVSHISPRNSYSAEDDQEFNDRASKAKMLTFDHPEEKNNKRDSSSSFSRVKLTKASSGTSLDNRTQSSLATKYEDARSSIREKLASGKMSTKASKENESRCCVII